MKFHRVTTSLYEPLATYEKGFKGMKNFGNTCYANAVLQVLLHTPIIVEIFLTHKIPLLVFLKKDSLTIRFITLLHDMWKNSNSSFISPKEFLIKFQYLTKTFNVLEQQDSQEFFGFVYRIIYDELTICINNNERYFYNVLDDIFMGELQYRIVCNECSHISVSKQSFMELSLSLKNNEEYKSSYYHPLATFTRTVSIFMKFLFNLSYYDKTTLDECLDRYFESETLTNNHQYYCPNCSKHVNAIKFCNISKLPNILVLHFSRFMFSLRQCFKLNNQVSFPFDCLSLSKYVVDDYDTNLDGSTEYQLYGILCHSGTIDFGHYYVYLYIENNGWYLFNDKKVSKVTDIYKITLDHPYLLFFERIISKTISLIQNLNLMEYFNNDSIKNVFVPNHWLTKFIHGIQSTPIDIRIYTCQHKKMNPIIFNLRNQIFAQITYNQWCLINKLHPNSPILTIDDECRICLDIYKNLQTEKNRFYHLNRHLKIPNTPTFFDMDTFFCLGDNGTYQSPINTEYSINVNWYEKWLQYVDFMNGNLQHLCVLWNQTNFSKRINITKEAWEFLSSIYSNDDISPFNSN